MVSKAKIVQMVDRNMVVAVVSIDNLESAMQARNSKFVGITSGQGPLREELRNQPKYSGFLGPMYDRDKDGSAMLRYEDNRSYDALST